jgi:hypothetical protein
VMSSSRNYKQPPGCAASHLVYGQVGVWADDCACAEVDALAAEVATEAALLALQPLHKAPAAQP